VFTAYQRSLSAKIETEMRAATECAEAQADEPRADTASAVADVIEVLRGAGVLAAPPRALLPGAQDQTSSAHAALN
jgi:hypothetical protein